MRAEHAIAAATALVAASCAAYGERYPSYDAVVAQYAEARYDSAPLDPSLAPECGDGTCVCPRAFFDGHWVYTCGDLWVYWYGGVWYYYPYLDAYLVTGAAHNGAGAVRSISKRPPAGHGHVEPSAPTALAPPAAKPAATRSAPQKPADPPPRRRR